jgi:hypothetical protein
MSAVANASAVYFGIIAAPLEYFDHTGIELADRFFFGDPWVALKPLNNCVKSKCQGLRQLRLAATGWAFDQNGLL